MNRNKIAAELMEGCPDESRDDHQEIADAILEGKSFGEICQTTEIDSWPETYSWLKTEMGDRQMEDKKYAVIEDVGYYGGDVQHPSGWRLSVATMTDNGNETDCIGTREECEEWLEELNDEQTYLSHGQASKSYRIAEILDDDADYQGWLDGLDWDGCPSEDGSDYDANTAWAEDRAYQTDGILPVADNNTSRLLLLNLTVED